MLEEDQSLQQRTTMSVNNNTCLLEFCLKSTYFTYQGKHYEQLEGAAMGSPINPKVANLYMENLPPYLWKRFVDDIFTIIELSQRRAFLNHIKSIYQQIQFTCKEQREDGSIPFLDILGMPNEDENLSSTVYRKSTHTDIYLQWDSLTKCKYPAWVLNRMRIKSRSQTKKKNCNNQKNTTTDIIQKPHIVAPYHRGLSDSFKKVCSNHGVQVYFKGGSTIKNLLMAPKDQYPMQKRSGVIYRY